MPNFDVTLDESAGCAVITVAGELDIATAPLLEDAVATAQAADRPLVVDMTTTTFCDSTGMTVVLRAHRTAGERGLGFALVCPEENREVTRVLSLLGFDGVLDIHQSRDRAVDRVCRRAESTAGDGV